MKKFILFTILIFGVFFANAQKIERVFTTDTVKGAETLYFYIDGYKFIDYKDVVLSFTGTKTDVADSLSLFRIQGANKSDFTDATNLTGNAALTKTTTNGAFLLYVTDPIYLYYRLAATCATGDTVIISAPKLTYKK